MPCSKGSNSASSSKRRSRKAQQTTITHELRTLVVRAATRYGAHDAEDVAQLVLIDCLSRPWLCEPSNVGALLQRTRFHVLHALRTARRFEARAGWRYTSYEQYMLMNAELRCSALPDDYTPEPMPD